MRYKVDKWTLGVRNIKVFVWNVQTLNLQQRNVRDTKINFILEQINKQFPEVIFLIDTAREFKIGGNYVSYFDGRNVLFTRKDLDLNVSFGVNWFQIDSIKLGFIYLTPGTYDKKELIPKLDFWNDNNWEFAGDFNLRTNKELDNKIRWRGGETSLQTGVVGKVESVRIFGSPSDHKLVTFMVKRKLRYNSILKVTRIEDKNIDYVDRILLGNLDYGTIPLNKYRVVETRRIENEEELTIMKIINNYKRSKVDILYDKFGWMWRNNRREPFMGTKVPQKVLDSFKLELKHDDRKIKTLYDEDIRELFTQSDIDVWTRKDNFGRIRKVRVDLPKSYSNAQTMESIKLDEIGNIIRRRFEIWIKERKNYKILNIQKEIVKAFNILARRDVFYSNTFFLKKNNELNSYRDVRMITVVPVLLKVWETLIYYKVLNEVNRTMSNADYQMGALKGSSTYYALYTLRAKAKRLDADGIVSLDLVKGYEKVDHSFLDGAIRNSGIKDETVECLLFWLHMVHSMDYMVNGQIVKASIGIPMGLSLSPLMFILYLDYALRGLSKEFLVCYMDDINIIFLKQEGNDYYVKEVFSRLKKANMIINDRKSKIFTYDEVINGKRQKDIFSGLSSSCYLTFLGRELTWIEDGITGEECSYVENFNIPKVFPNWLTLAMRRLILIGGICAKHRFVTYMWAFERVDFKARYLKMMYNFLRINFEKFNYMQLIMIYPNLLREFIDFATWINVGKEFEVALCDLLGDRYWKLQSRDLVCDRINKALEKVSELNKDAFEKLRNKLMTVFLNYIRTDMDQIDPKINGEWNYGFLYALIIFAAQHNGSWSDARSGLNKGWELYKVCMLEVWISQQQAKEKKYLFDLTNAVDFDFRFFVSYKYFGILMDMLFGRLNIEGVSDWDFWLFAILERTLDFLENKIQYEDFFKKLNFPKFKIVTDALFEKRFDLVKKLVTGISQAEYNCYGLVINRWTKKSSPEFKQWFDSKKYIKKFRKIFFSLDSIYAKKDLRSKDYNEISIAFQLKLHASNVNNKEFEKVLLIQDYEELDLEDYNKMEEEIEFGDSDSEV